MFKVEKGVRKMRYEDRLKIEIEELESLLLELSNFKTLNQFYACIDGKLDGKKKVRKLLAKAREELGHVPYVHI